MVWKFLPYILIYNCCALIADRQPVRAGEMPLRYKIIVQSPTSGNSTTNLYPDRGQQIELNAEQQEFDRDTQVINASGKVTLRFKNATLTADLLRVNLKTKTAVADGVVTLQRGRQVLRGDRFEYNFDTDSGKISNGNGDIYQPSLIRDLNIAKNPINAPIDSKDLDRPTLIDKLRADSPVVNIRSGSSTGVSIGSDRDIEFQPTLKPKGKISRLRFQAGQIDFTGDRIRGEDVRITNDPLSPPELQIRADRAEFKTRSEEEDEITTSNARITIEDNLNIPIPFLGDRLILNKLGKNPNPFNIGFDGDERGGIFLESSFYPIATSQLRWSVTPQYFIQKAISQFQFIDGDTIGVKSDLFASLGRDTNLDATAALSGIKIDRLGDRLRSKVALRQNLSLLDIPHTLTGETVYRERVFNGTLGYQDLQSSIGATLGATNIPLGSTGISADYLIGGQIITARTDRPDLLRSDRTSDLITLNRYQGAIGLAKSFRLWEGKGLPTNERATYNYSPVPVVPICN